MRSLSAKEVLRLALAFVPKAMASHRFPHLSREEIARYQWRQIKKLVDFAYASVPFYRRKYDEAGIRPEDIRTIADFKRLPCVTKQEIIANYPQAMLARGTDMESVIVSKSSGSSGQVLNVVYTLDAVTTYVLAGFRIFTMGMDYYPWHRQVYIYTSPYPFNSILGMYPLHFIPTVNDIDETVAQLRRLRPDLLVCYPSHLRQIGARLTAGDRRRIRPRAISVNSEMSTQKERDELAQVFGCGVYDEYSTEELTRVAAQCKQRNYHIFEDINYIEVLDERGQDAPEGAVGEIVGTNLHNFCMPFIRYRQADLGAVVREPCPCGRNFSLLRNFKGRKNDQFVLPSGKVLSSGFLLDASYNLILDYKDAIKDFCVIQETPSEITVEVIAGATFNEQIAFQMREQFRDMIKDEVTVRVRTVEQLYKTKTGKQNPIISKVK